MLISQEILSQFGDQNLISWRYFVFPNFALARIGFERKKKRNSSNINFLEERQQFGKKTIPMEMYSVNIVFEKL